MKELNSPEKQLPNTSLSGRREKPNWLIALAVTLVFALGNYLMSHTSPGRWLEFKAYDLLHTALPDLGRNFPIVVADISEIPFDPDNPTSRTILKSVMSQIFDRGDEQKPAAIGIDIDFSPMLNRRPSQEEQDFFALCNDICKGRHADGGVRKAVPVYLGVGRTAYNSPDEWFGYRDYIPMAANINVNPEDTHQAVRWTLDREGKVYGEQRWLPSMGQALAQAYADHPGRSRLPRPGSSAFCVETIPPNPASQAESPIGGTEEEIIVEVKQTEQQKDGTKKEVKKQYELVDGLSLVNYSKLDQMREQPVKVEMRNGKPVVSGDFAGKIVLLGDAQARDVFTVPGPIKPLKGVYLHACAAYTFVREPLYNLKNIWRFWLDVLLSGVLVVLLAFVESRACTNPLRSLYGKLAHYSLLVLVLAVGLNLVRFTGIMWFDFIAIVVALWIHPATEHFIAHHWKHAKERREKKWTAKPQPTPPYAEGEQ